MGIDVNIYTKGFSVDLIPEIKKRFSDFQMYIEFHPEFKFDEQTDTGFLPIKLKVYPEHSKHYDNIDYEILTGFELFFSDYDFEEELKNIQPEAVQSENRSFLSRLFGSNNAALPTTISFVANEQLDKLLKDCKKDVMLNLKSWNKSELRVSLFFAAILAELTDGVIYEPQSGRFLTGRQALNAFPLEIEDYEQSFTLEEFTVDKFEGWI